MMFAITPQPVDPTYGEALLPLEAAKTHLRVDGDRHDEDDLIAQLRDTAIDMVEKFANLLMGPVSGQVATFAGFGERMRIGVGPLATFVVTGVSYDGGGEEPVAIGVGGWRLDGLGGLIPARGTTWPFCSGGVSVTYSAGYPANACPPSLIAAAKICLGHLYQNREGVDDMPLPAAALARPFRMPVL